MKRSGDSISGQIWTLVIIVTVILGLSIIILVNTSVPGTVLPSAGGVGLAPIARPYVSPTTIVPLNLCGSSDENGFQYSGAGGGACGVYGTCAPVGNPPVTRVCVSAECGSPWGCAVPSATEGQCENEFPTSLGYSTQFLGCNEGQYGCKIIGASEFKCLTLDLPDDLTSLWFECQPPSGDICSFTVDQQSCVDTGGTWNFCLPSNYQDIWG
jgi:hypothetical protein